MSRYPMLAFTLAAVAPLSTAALGAGGDEPWSLPERGYVEELLAANRKERTVAGLRLEVSVVSDAYRYFMAKGFEELAEGGYEGRALESRLRALHRKYRAKKGNFVFVASLRGSGKDRHFFLKASIDKHFRLEQRGRRSLSELRDKGAKRIAFLNWKVFENRPNVPRKIFRQRLSRFERLSTVLYSTSVRTDKNEAFTISVSDVVGVTHTGGIQSVNRGSRQISCEGWRELHIPSVELRYYPKRLERPRAPRGFDELLDRLAKS